MQREHHVAGDGGVCHLGREGDKELGVLNRLLPLELIEQGVNVDIDPMVKNALPDSVNRARLLGLLLLTARG